MKKVSSKVVVGIEEDPSQPETTFSMANVFSYNNVYSVGWCVDSGASINNIL
jgi:hypothetical protein